jgi:membrane-associated PAP2 superfamily phosphatase
MAAMNGSQPPSHPYRSHGDDCESALFARAGHEPKAGSATECAVHEQPSRFLLRHVGPLLVAIALLIAMEPTSIDSTVTGWFFDPAAGIFPLRYSMGLEVIGHQWAKLLVIMVACSAIVFFLLSFVLESLKPRRRLLLFLVLALTLAPLTVVALRAASDRHCPRDIQEYGGFAPHLSLFDALPPGLKPGHCFPASHAAAGFSLMAFYFVGRALNRRRLARLGLYGGLIAGLTLGMVRIAQGVHYVSYVLWAGAICWAVILGLYLAVMNPFRSAPVMPAGGVADDRSETHVFRERARQD